MAEGVPQEIVHCPHCGEPHPRDTKRCPSTGLVMGGDPSLVGSLVGGRYQLVRLLGDGGMGAVYKAADPVLRRFVAVKLLHPAVAKNASAVERFQREARAAAAIGHPNIIDVIDFGTHEGAPFMVMEYLRGRSVAQAISREGPFEITRACAVAAHALAGLAAAHARGIIHRDIKPANLMLVAHLGDRDFVKICDFGFAALLRVEKTDGRSLTPERVLVGTPAYAAPERMRSKDPRDARADIYSIGVVLFEMLAGRRPFDGVSLPEIAKSVLHHDPPSVRAFRPDVTPELDAVVHRALARDPDARYTTPDLLAEALVPFGGRAIDQSFEENTDTFTMDLAKIRARELFGERGLAIPRRTSKPPPDSVKPPPAEAPVPLTRAKQPRATEDLDATERPSPALGRAVARPKVGGSAPRDTVIVSARSVPPERAIDDSASENTATHLFDASSPRPVRVRASGAMRTRSEERRVPGEVALAVLEFVSSRFGARRLTDTLDALDANAAAPFVEGVSPASSVPLSAMCGLVGAIDAHLGRDDLHLVVECGRAIAARIAPRVLRSVVPPKPEDVVSRIGELTSAVLAGARADVLTQGEGFARIELRDEGSEALHFTVGALGFLERALADRGGLDVEVTLVSCIGLGDARTLFELTWLEGGRAGAKATA